MRSRFSWALLGLLIVVAAPAFADDKADAQARFNAGQEAYKKDDYATAIKEFEAAYKLDKNPVYLYNIAVAYELWGKKEKAAEFYEKYLPDADPKEKADVQNKINSLRPNAPVTPPADNKSKVDIRTDPPGASVWLEEKKGQPQGATPFTASVTPGKHILIIELNGYVPVTRTFEVLAGQTATLDLALPKQESSVMISVQSNVVGAKVYLDDRSQGVAGITPFQMMTSVGKHTLIAEKEGYEPATEEFELKPGEAGPVTIKIKMDKGNYGRLQVNSNVKGAVVEIDGDKLGTVPFPGELPQVATGSHKIKVSANGYDTWEGEIEVASGGTVQVKTTLAKKPNKAGAAVALMIAAGFAGGGVVIGKQAESEFNSIQDDLDAGLPVDDNDPRFQAGFREALIADACYAVGGVVFLASATRFLTKGKKSKGEVFNSVSPVSQSDEQNPTPAALLSPVGAAVVPASVVLARD